MYASRASRHASGERRNVDRDIEFLVATEWESESAIRHFVGDNIGLAVVPPEVQAMMVDFIREVDHYEAVVRHF